MAALAIAFFSLSSSMVAAQESAVEEVLVLGDATLASDFADVGNFQRIDGDVLARTGAVHVNEAMVRVPGVWVSRGSGQEHLTAIRSPVLTGAGACGAFLLMENGVPIRPGGFCNVNNLFELHTELAAGIEVVRGPASGLYGGNALRGVVNVLAPQAGDRPRLQLEAGPWDYRRLSASAGIGDAVDVAFTGVDAGGWRDDTGHDQQKLSVTIDSSLGDWSVRTLLSATNLEQETGGFVQGFEAYEDGALRDTNPNPEAFRDAWALRASSAFSRELDDGRRLVLTPYLRASDMDFLQHFLPGQPLEENGQVSGGLLARLHGSSDRLQWTVGGHVELADTFLEQTQDGPTVGSAFLVATRPPGTHYDYEVRSDLVAAFYDLRYQASDALSLVHSLRVERTGYDYDNRFLDGNTRDDGTTCGFGGCLYTRPADRDDDFTNLAGRVGLEYAPGGDWRAWMTAAVGFRAPQMTELYRLQRGQTVADLDSESISSFELGYRRGDERMSLGVVGFLQRSRDEIIRLANGFNVDSGETESVGVEFDLRWQASTSHAFDLVGSWASHEYAFDAAVGGGSSITSGDEVDTAPNWMGSAHWNWQISERVASELEGVYVGSYQVDPANSDDYRGHFLLNARVDGRITDRIALSARVLNLLDERYADRADFAFGSYRYFPGLPRRVHVALTVDL